MAVYDRARRRLVIHGGTDSGFQPLDDTWTLPLDGSPLAWSNIAASGTAPRVQSVPAAYDPVRDRMVVLSGDPAVARALSFGGTPAWTALSMFGVAPLATFQGLSGCYDPSGDRMVALSTSGNPWSLRFSAPEQLGVTPIGPDQGARVVLAISALLPNPAGGHFAIEYSTAVIAPVTAEVFDIRGRRVLRRADLSAGPGSHRARIDLPQALDPGVYFIRIAQAGRIATSRIALVR